ncbi:hypothetical protein, partial [Candidatus Electronema sp. TJ]|uniref:hypothetical protein n=1 Tax=Candidatus Electronema sp. TJ TaxID=3401573 RepID=UPI003AA91C5F
LLYQGSLTSFQNFWDRFTISLPSSFHSSADHDAAPHVYCSLCTNTAADLEHYARFSRCHSIGIGG